MYLPWPEMFGDAAMRKLSGHLGLDDKVEAARRDFLAVGERIRTIIDATPSSFDHGPDDMSLSKRARWLQQQILNPVEALRDALADDPKFAQYPENHTSALAADERYSLAQSLARLARCAADLRDDLAARSDSRHLSHNIEMRREFLFWIAQAVRRHAPNLDAQRSYTGVDDGNGKGNASPFFAAVKLAYVEITREAKPQLEDHFKELVRMGV